MRRELARGGLLSAAAAVLVAAALFAADGSSDSRLFWIGGGAIVVVGAVGADVLFGRRAAVSLSGPGAAFLVLLAALALWQAGSIVWSIQPSRSWAYANRGLVYFAFACLGVLLGGVPARRLAAGTAALIGALLVWAVTAKVVPALYS